MKKQILPGLAITAIGFALLPTATQANPLITGGISFTGGKATAELTDGSATPNLDDAQQIEFSNATGGFTIWSSDPTPPPGAGPGAGAAHVDTASGSFSGSLNHFVTMYSPLVIDPVTLPSGALWTVDGLSLTLTDLSIDYRDSDVLFLSGSGYLSAAGFEDTLGDWYASFEVSPDQPGELVTFGWSASTDSAGTKAPTVPDGGATAILLGSALTGLGLFGRKQLKKA